MKRANTEAEVIRLIQVHRLTREMIPSKWLNSLAVWEALLERMPMTAMVRNLGKMTSLGLIAPMSAAQHKIYVQLTNAEHIKKSRLHPMSVLVAMDTYKQGYGRRGNLTWSPNARVVDALDEAFYLAFGNIEPTNKRIMCALDVSGSMTSEFINKTNISARVASAAMAMVTARTEPNHMLVSFTTRNGQAMRWSSDINEQSCVKPMSISPRQRLDDIIRVLDYLPFGGTDCALPFLYALENRIPLDAVIIYTDNESWKGQVHVTQAVDMYRQRMGIDVKLIACAMTATDYSVADPQDPKQVDVVGFDTSTPAAISEFVRG
jgi:60 kDa SS-A/Ro ribonucleoprotein